MQSPTGLVQSATVQGDEASEPLHAAEGLIPSVMLVGEPEKPLLLLARDLDSWPAAGIPFAEAVVRQTTGHGRLHRSVGVSPTGRLLSAAGVRLARKGRFISPNGLFSSPKSVLAPARPGLRTPDDVWAPFTAGWSVSPRRSVRTACHCR